MGGCLQFDCKVKRTSGVGSIKGMGMSQDGCTWGGGVMGLSGVGLR